MTWPSIIRKERKRRELTATMEMGLAAICGVCAAVMTLRGDVFAVFAAAGMTVNALNAREDLRKVRELEVEEEDARAMQIAFIFEAQRRFEEALSPACAGENEPRSGKQRGRVIHLALRHRKARVRKKNANRIMREEKKNGR